MIHIYNKIYITYAETSISHEDHNKLPDTFIQIIDKNIGAISNPIHDHKRVLRVKNVTELVNHYESASKLFDGLMCLIETRSPKLVIYADDNAMVEFLCSWWKSLFPSLTVDGALALYRLFGDSETLRNKGRNLPMTLNPNGDNSFNGIMKTYWGKSKEDFTVIFDQAVAFEVETNHKEQCSIEFHVMNYILDSNYAAKSVLLEKLENMFAKTFMNEVFDIKDSIERNLYFYAMKDSTLNANAVLNGESLKDSIKRNAVLSSLMDDKITDNKKGFQYLKDNFNLPKFCNSLLVLDNKNNADCIPNEIEVRYDNPCVAYVAENRKLPNMEEILALEIQNKSYYKLLSILAKKSRLNPYLIPAMVRSVELNLPVVQEFKF